MDEDSFGVTAAYAAPSLVATVVIAPGSPHDAKPNQDIPQIPSLHQVDSGSGISGEKRDETNICYGRYHPRTHIAQPLFFYLYIPA